MVEMQNEPRRYDAIAAQERWQQYWAENGTFNACDDGSKPRRYVLDMFAYPSGDLHMGHGEAWAINDVYSRYLRLKGFDVLHPVGWDSFGLPAENAAIKRNAHPAEWTYANIETQAASFRRYGISFDWRSRLHTSDVEYYRWTQWFFLKFYERGLAYLKDSYVNWCPTDQTVLANEQVKDGKCERCGSLVTKRKLMQWYFKITQYAQRLLDDMSQLEGGWPDRVLAMQRNWIGRSEGAYVRFAVAGRAEPIQVFTTRPDTLHGVTFLVVAPDSDLAEELVAPAARATFESYREEVKKQTEIERQATDHKKTGVDLGITATNPVTGESIPVWAADYVLSEYGTGAIMAVPAHDQRDLEFAQTFGLPIRVVIDNGQDDPAISGVPAAGDGTYVNSGSLTGLTKKAEGISQICGELEAAGTGEKTITYRLRDWLVSRQRFWGCPIPMIHCPACGVVPVPEDQLPVELPDLRGAALLPKGESPLATAEEWKQVDCPQCGGSAQRDTDTMDTFVDSSWYMLRYPSPHYTDGPFDPEAAKRWLPIAQYMGGVEHATGHLIFSRFFTKVCKDMGLIDFDEFALRLMNQGQVINEGKAMSKSLGNGVDLGKQIDEFGVDAVRTTIVFAGPPDEDIDWADVSPGSTLKFLQRAYRIATEVASEPGAVAAEGDKELRRITHKTIAEVSQLIESGRFNVVVARIMELTNAIRKAIDAGLAADPAVREAAETTAIFLSLTAPYLAEDMWELLGHAPSVANASWLVADESLLVADEITIVVQIQGKVRATLTFPPDVDEQTVIDA
ncbi:MAG: leucine--tRNA ligase, partial [Propionibacteriaceae bacterium]